MSKVRHIVWDWNGTLFDDAGACVETLNAVLRRRGRPETNLDAYRERFGFPVKRYYEQALGMDFAVENWDEMAREFHDLYNRISRKYRLRDGVLDILRALHRAEVPMSVLSASEVTLLEDALARHRIRRYFKRVEGLDDLYAHSKVETGRRLVGVLGVPAENILLIGDTIHDFEIASDLGCGCVLVAGGHQSEHRLQSCGCPVLTGVPELIRCLTMKFPLLAGKMSPLPRRKVQEVRHV